MNLKFFIKKVWRVIQRKPIKILSFVDSNFYTRCYVAYLKKYGMDIDGLPRYISPSAYFDGNDYSIIHIGKDSVISKDVKLLTHDFSIARALQAIGKNNSDLNRDEMILEGIYIGENTFIGMNTLIMPGAYIGNNVIIGAGSIVKGNIPDNSIAYGNPAKVKMNTIEWANEKYIEGKYFIEFSK